MTYHIKEAKKKSFNYHQFYALEQFHFFPDNESVITTHVFRKINLIAQNF